MIRDLAGKSLPIMIATLSYCFRRNCFVSEFFEQLVPIQSPHSIVLGAITHAECWVGGYLVNVLIFSYDTLMHYSAILVMA